MFLNNDIPSLCYMLWRCYVHGFRLVRYFSWTKVEKITNDVEIRIYAIKVTIEWRNAQTDYPKNQTIISIHLFHVIWSFFQVSESVLFYI